MFRVFARPSLYFLVPVLICVTLAGASVFGYSWFSHFNGLMCSIQDDSFYYFVPAWNGGHGAGLTFGGEKTSGFQPLYEVLLASISGFCDSLESLVRLAINLNGWMFALTALVAGLVVGRLADGAFPGMRRTAVAVSMSVAALVFLCLHTAFFSSLTGKENALAALLLTTTIWAALGARQHWLSAAALGLLCGLLLLTRIAPASILYVGIALISVQGRTGKLVALGAFLLPVVSWGVFAHLYFGHMLPMSMLVKMNAGGHVSILHSIKIGFGYFVESMKFSLSAHSRFNLLQLRAREATRSGWQLAVMLLALGGAVFGLARCLLLRRWSRAVLVLSAFDAAAVLCNVAFGALQVGRSDDMYYSVWYVYDLPELIALNCGFAIAWLQSQLEASRHSGKITALLAMACVLYFFTDIAWYVRLKPYDSTDDAKFAVTWQHKKIEVAQWFLDNVKPANPNYKVVAFSAGQFSYFLFDHVVNLDGLANDAAGRALMTRSVVEYAKQIKPDYLIEICHGETEFDNLQRLHVISFPQQGDYCIDRFVYE